MTEADRPFAVSAVARAPLGFAVIVQPSTRSLSQNAAIHALIYDIVKARFKFRERTWNMEDWKRILSSAHDIETGHKSRVIPGLHDEFVTLYEATSKMSVPRAASFITFLKAFCDQNQIPRREDTQ